MRAGLAPLADVRCPHCGKLLCRMSDGALAPGQRVQWKCDRCNQFSERVGQTDQKPVEAPCHPAAVVAAMEQT